MVGALLLLGFPAPGSAAPPPQTAAASAPVDAAHAEASHQHTSSTDPAAAAPTRTGSSPDGQPSATAALESAPADGAPDSNSLHPPAEHPPVESSEAAESSGSGGSANPHTADAAPTAEAAPAPAAPPVRGKAPTGSPPGDETVQSLRWKAEAIRALLRGELALDVRPVDLFDVFIADPRAVSLERRRLTRVLSPDASSGGSAAVPQALPPGAAGGSAQKGELEGPSAKPVLLPVPGDVDDLVSPELWRVRLELDRARLAFYRLPVKEREALLQAHERRVAEDEDVRQRQPLSDAELEAEEAEKAKQEALLLAKQAHSEAERAVFEESARLSETSRRQAEYEKELLSLLESAKDDHDEMLGLRRQLEDALSAARGTDQQALLDEDYDRLARNLVGVREKLRRALRRLASDGRNIPEPGPDRLTSLPVDVERREVDELRARTISRVEELAQRESEVLHEVARLRMEDLDMLSHLRLQFLPRLSSDKREQITGLTLVGFTQVRAEIQQVILTLRYHLRATKSWVVAMKKGSGRGESALMASLVALRWLLPIGLFIIWRRRADQVLSNLRRALRERHSKKRGSSPLAPPGLRVLRIVSRVRRPTEWLLLVWAVFALLPDEMQALLEVRLIVAILLWLFGGALVVTTIDALSSDELRGHRRASTELTGHLRLKSLRLAGRAVVIFGLVLSLTSRLVGKGTVYGWVLSSSYLAAAAIVLVLIRWWRPAIFQRVELVRKKGQLENWILSNRTGAASFVAAFAGGAYLFATGAMRLFRSWIVTFTVVRRLLAYLFRRGMDKQAKGAQGSHLRDIPAHVYEALGPELASSEMVTSAADDDIGEVISRIELGGGGVFAVVGERGSGKSTLLRRLEERSERLTRVECPLGGLAALDAALRHVTGHSEETTIDDVLLQLDSREGDSAILIDDVQRLLSPTMGGLNDYDRLLDYARRFSNRCTWVLSLDTALWRFVDRARGNRPAFDGVVWLSQWSEEAIVRLINHRNEAAGIRPNFELLLGELAEDADEYDRMEALDRTETAYYRLLWDYASGNPAVALHFWRKCLGIDEHQEIFVRPFSAPDPDALESLPDSAVFVLRAAVQMDGATEQQIEEATGLGYRQVADALRYGLMRGFFVRRGERFEMTWDWYRAITRFLARQHLLSFEK